MIRRAMIRKAVIAPFCALAIAATLIPSGIASASTSTHHAVVGAGQSIECFHLDCWAGEALWLDASDAGGGSGHAVLSYGSRSLFRVSPVSLDLFRVVIESPTGFPTDYHEVHALGRDPLGAAYCVEVRIWNSVETRDLFSVFGPNGDACASPSFRDTDALTGFTVFESDSTPNLSPHAGSAVNCSRNICNFDASSSADIDGSIVRHDWNFDDGTVGTGRLLTHSFPITSYYQQYQVTLRVTDDDGAQGSETRWVGIKQNPPTASFTFGCINLRCTFTDTSTDTDGGSISSWLWNFGNNSSTAQNSSHTYRTGGTYTVELTVTDNGGATGTSSQTVTVTAPSIALTASGYKVKTRKYVDLNWSGAASTEIDLYRNGKFIGSTANDGAHTDFISQSGTFAYVVCEKSTSTCSDPSYVSF